MRWILMAAALAAALSFVSADAAHSQSPGQPGSTPGAPAAPEQSPGTAGAATQAAPSTAGGSPPTAAPPTASYARASWTSDAVALRVGDLLTVVIDEQTTAREFSSRLATAERSTDAALRMRANGEDAVGATGVQAGLDGSSRNVGELNRTGDLVANLTVRVTAVDERGIARIEGTKKVLVDGREQLITLQGFVRPEDVPPSNVILSSRIAEASFGYKGKGIGPHRSLIGRILSMLWP